jgi:hypothetical protein
MTKWGWAVASMLRASGLVTYNQIMETIIRNVKDLAEDERRSLEQALGQQLHEGQKLIVHVVLDANASDTGEGKSDAASVEGTSRLPPWCDVYAGLSDDEIAEVEQVILTRSDWTRSSG